VTASQEILAGVIAAEADPPGLSREAWQQQVEREPRLRSVDGRDAAEIVLDGQVVGRIQWSTTVANELDVYGVLDQVSDVAWNLAAALGGHFVTLAELTRC
jgi:hypothetical protein